jgi:hypothetical protein
MSTALLFKLKAVVKDGSTPVASKPTVQPVELSQFTAGHFLVEYVNEDGSAHSLVYDTPLHAVRFRPTDDEPAISLQGSVLDVDDEGEPADNWARFELVPGHWTDVPPRMYGHQGVLLIGGDPDDHVIVVPHSTWKTTPAAVHPGDDVQVPDTQAPLAQGPQGDQGEQGPAGEFEFPEVSAADVDAVLVPTDEDPVAYAWKRRARGVLTFTEGGALYQDVDLTGLGFTEDNYEVHLSVFQAEDDGPVTARVVPSSGAYPTLAADGFRVRLVDAANCKVFYRVEAL